MLHLDCGKVADRQLACVNVSLVGTSVYTAVYSSEMRTAQSGTVVRPCINSTDQPNASSDVWAKTDSADTERLAIVENRMLIVCDREFECCRPEPGVRVKESQSPGCRASVYIGALCTPGTRGYPVHDRQ